MRTEGARLQATDDPTQGEGERITRAISQRLLLKILHLLSQNLFRSTLTSSDFGLSEQSESESFCVSKPH